MRDEASIHHKEPVEVVAICVRSGDLIRPLPVAFSADASACVTTAVSHNRFSSAAGTVPIDASAPAKFVSWSPSDDDLPASFPEVRL
jgi:hypothetical protein